LPEHVSFLAGPLDHRHRHLHQCHQYHHHCHHRSLPYHRQSFLSLSRPSQQITASTNARDTSHRGRTDQSHRQFITRCRAIRNRLQTPRTQATHRCRTDAAHSQDLL
jgi:hypothetical protein